MKNFLMVVVSLVSIGSFAHDVVGDAVAYSPMPVKSIERNHMFPVETVTVTYLRNCGTEKVGVIQEKVSPTQYVIGVLGASTKAALVCFALPTEETETFSLSASVPVNVIVLGLLKNVVGDVDTLEESITEATIQKKKKGPDQEYLVWTCRLNPAPLGYAKLLTVSQGGITGLRQVKITGKKVKPGSQPEVLAMYHVESKELSGGKGLQLTNNKTGFKLRIFDQNASSSDARVTAKEFEGSEMRCERAD